MAADQSNARGVGCLIVIVLIIVGGVLSLLGVGDDDPDPLDPSGGQIYTAEELADVEDCDRLVRMRREVIRAGNDPIGVEGFDDTEAVRMINVRLDNLGCE